MSSESSFRETEEFFQVRVPNFNERYALASHIRYYCIYPRESRNLSLTLAHDLHKIFKDYFLNNRTVEIVLGDGPLKNSIEEEEDAEYSDVEMEFEEF